MNAGDPGSYADRVARLAPGLIDMRRTAGCRRRALSPAEDEAVLREAGFADVELFYAAFTFRGWTARAPGEPERG